MNLTNCLERLKIVKENIVTIKVDAIVNAAAPHLLGGAGVDGAIHKAAGPELKAECITLGGCKTGEAKITKAYNLPCKYVIHTVGPVYNKDELELQINQLKNCYINCFKLAKKHNIKSIAFPCIANGIYGFPIRISTKHVFDVCLNALNENPELVVYLVCYNLTDFEKYVDYYVELKSNI